MKRAVVDAATRAIAHHRVEWFPPDPPNHRTPIYLCLGCGWQHGLHGYADESDAGLEHRIEAALAASLPPTDAEAEARAQRHRADDMEDKALRAQTDLRAAAERAGAAEAERDEWRQTALDERAGLLDALGQIKARDARIQAVRELHQQSSAVRVTPRAMRETPGDREPSPWCVHCHDKWPCPTIRALEGGA